MKYNAALFDLDGTLLNTIEDLSLSFNTVLERRGYPLFSVEEYKLLVGNGAENVIRKIIPKESISEELVEECLAEFGDVYGAGCLMHTKPYPGIVPLLRKLEEKGVRFSVLSNKPHEMTVKSVRFYFPVTPFHSIVGKKKDTKLKPDPQSALKILEEMKIPPEKAFFVGDTATDIQTAANAAVFSVGALWGFRSEKELVESGAKKIVSDPLEIMELLE